MRKPNDLAELYGPEGGWSGPEDAHLTSRLTFMDQTNTVAMEYLKELAQKYNNTLFWESQKASNQAFLDDLEDPEAFAHMPTSTYLD